MPENLVEVLDVALQGPLQGCGPAPPAARPLPRPPASGALGATRVGHAVLRVAYLNKVVG